MMNYENPEYTGNIEFLLESIDMHGEQQVIAALQDLYDDRATESLAGMVGDTDAACEAVALSFIEAYQEYGDMGPIEDHFYNPRTCVTEAIRNRTTEIKREYMYSELEVLIESTPNTLARTLTLPPSPNTPEQTLSIDCYYGSGVGGITIDAEIYDDNGFSSMYEIKMKKVKLNDSRIAPHALHMMVFADPIDQDDNEEQESDERLLFDIPEYHKSIIVDALGDMVEEEIALQFQNETARLERIMHSTQDPVELRTKLEGIDFIY